MELRSMDSGRLKRQSAKVLKVLEQAKPIDKNRMVKRAEFQSRVARKQLPARLQEQALVDYFASYSEEVSRRTGKPIDLASLKPYTGTHNSGYTECQEFYGAITLESAEPLGNRIVTMLDVALRGIGNHWNDIRIPGFDYLVIENTLGKFGRKVETFNALPINVQALVGGRSGR